MTRPLHRRPFPRPSAQLAPLGELLLAVLPRARQAAMLAHHAQEVPDVLRNRKGHPLIVKPGAKFWQTVNDAGLG